ncbi:DNA-directed RNA polymerase III subunit RPC7 isoform X1 [Harpia harpyja]|uniref:DNA-directed RNA polymerase III subunit RPC7 isoform X1 n=1 Tax=Harpia harpyja TaxID=202280 RepID=UPI0022B108B5|nr:DNA-directed RNA polymerase III subunit RPC7 isoform X1 [Harpia harpyja]
MAGSGTGRGRTAFTFNIDALGFGKGAALPDTVSKPPPTYPSTENKPVPLKTGEDEDYMLALKQDLRATMKQMPYFLAVEEDREVIERYRKKYQNSGKEHQTWTPDWRRLPREVKPKKKTKKGANPKKAKSFESKSNLDVLKKIEELEKKDDEEEKSEDEEDKKEDKPKDKEGDDDEEQLEEDDEEEHEEENDYISSYFEDGDDFGDGSDDNMDEATY